MRLFSIDNKELSVVKETLAQRYWSDFERLAFEITKEHFKITPTKFLRTRENKDGGFDAVLIHELGTLGEMISYETLMEAKLLRYLIENEGRPVSRNAILEDVWQLQEDTDTRAIDNFIVRLRKYLEDSPTSPKILQTVRGVGYRYVKPQ